jgi:hypothetical protein
MGPRSFRIWILGPKLSSAPTKTDLPYNFCYINFFPSLTVEAVDALQTLFRGRYIIFPYVTIPNVPFPNVPFPNVKIPNIRKNPERLVITML